MSCVIKSSVGGADGEDVSLGSPGGSELRRQGRSAAAPPRQPGGWTALLLSRLLAPTLSPGLPESTPSSQKRQRDKESDSSGLASAALLRDVQPRGLRDLQGGEHLPTGRKRHESTLSCRYWSSALRNHVPNVTPTSSFKAYRAVMNIRFAY